MSKKVRIIKILAFVLELFIKQERNSYLEKNDFSKVSI
ncbi:hypothetical protein SULYE_0661 [Sulfurihydrogenibium yellowstonense SS-5]|uniref:Uncharacterized protein n=1 Tax=Sulfurihydrogenibium yellowstonense SS-5 TaxID=432331 RepID=C4FJB9_9AQUI|nr:hypothetical protein SULYE_0661 [Sulfurihydrogenibium yellowstonense SS-5]